MINVNVYHVLDSGYRLDLCQEPWPYAPAGTWQRLAYAVEGGFGWAVITKSGKRFRQELVADRAAARRALQALTGGGVR